MANQDALRDGNRTPTLLFEQTNEIRRVSEVNPLPVAVVGTNFGLTTVTFEKVGPGTVALVTPSAGKKVAVRGAMITLESATGAEVDIRFATTNKLIHKVYRGDQTGDYVELNLEGNVNELVNAVVVGISAGQKVFFLVNYQEK
ncbi:MAG: hypothetical protein KCHDKBKB_02222 [Elusimicrobia bacterium]|nr:hypothetical protein [Elusimicrobiota bacterium]